MPYGALLIPKDTKTKEPKTNGFLDSLKSVKNKMMSGWKDGGLSIDNATTLFKNTADLIVENKDAIMGKFCGIGLTQLLVNGKITNKTAINYLKQGFPQALGKTSVAMGFQSVDALITALQAPNGVNVKTFISSFENFGTALNTFFNGEQTRQNVEGYQVVEIDVVSSDTRNYNAETPDRRVQSGQSFQEYVHNMPDTFTIECYLQEGKRYTTTEFESIILTARKNKMPIDVILGEDRKKTCIITSFVPIRERTDGFRYSLELKQIDVGSIKVTNVYEPNIKTNIIQNKLDEVSTKTSSILFKGSQKPNAIVDKALQEKFNGLFLN